MEKKTLNAYFHYSHPYIGTLLLDDEKNGLLFTAYSPGRNFVQSTILALHNSLISYFQKDNFCKIFSEFVIHVPMGQKDSPLFESTKQQHFETESFIRDIQEMLGSVVYRQKRGVATHYSNRLIEALNTLKKSEDNNYSYQYIINDNKNTKQKYFWALLQYDRNMRNSKIKSIWKERPGCNEIRKIFSDIDDDVIDAFISLTRIHYQNSLYHIVKFPYGENLL